MKLLIAFDGSEHARDAIRDLARAGLPEDVTAVVMSVGEATVTNLEPPPVDPGLSRRAVTAMTAARAEAVDALQDARQLADEGASLVQSSFPRWTVQADAGLGAPGHLLLNRARHLGADLVVVGSHGRSRLARLLIGSVSQQLATEATTSVLVSRHVRNRVHSPVRIMVGIDGSSSSRAAVDAVAARHWQRGTEVHLTAVAETHRPTSTVKVPTAAGWVVEANQARRDRARASLDESIDLLTHIGVRVSGKCAEGVAQRVLCDGAAQFGADSIFIGGDSFGSDTGPTTAADVVGAMVTAAPCSVEVVR